MDHDVPEAVIAGVELFNNRYYWEAHEVWEDYWMEIQGAKKTFVQGLIQATASFYHVLNENPQGVIKLAPEATKKLKSSQDQGWNDVVITNLLVALEDFQVQAHEMRQQKRSGFDFSRLPQISLGATASAKLK